MPWSFITIGAVSEVEAMTSRVHVCGVFVLAWAMLSFSVTATFTLSGSEKDAWPELIHANVSDAISILTNGGLVKNIYVQPPSSGAPPPNLGLPTDVWLYTDGTSVYEMPRRGVWHNNRLSPGWPEVAGTNYKAAISKIKEDVIGVDVIYGPKGFLRIGDLQLSRVWLDINNDGTVAGVPSIG